MDNPLWITGLALFLTWIAKRRHELAPLSAAAVPPTSWGRLIWSLSVFFIGPAIFMIWIAPLDDRNLARIGIQSFMIISLWAYPTPKIAHSIKITWWEPLFFFAWCLAIQQLLVQAILFFFTYFNISTVTQGIVQSVEKADPLEFALMALSIAILAPLIEEKVFRGTLQPFLKHFMGPWTAIILTSLIFSLCHFEKEMGLSNLLVLPVLFVTSCFFGLFYERKLTLWAPFMLHALHNSLTLLTLLPDALFISG